MSYDMKVSPPVVSLFLQRQVGNYSRHMFGSCKLLSIQSIWKEVLVYV